MRISDILKAASLLPSLCNYTRSFSLRYALNRTLTGIVTTAVWSQAVATTCSGTPAPTGTWDYIVVGAGAAGIPLADKLSESGKSVLLIEKGPPSSGRWGGTMKPDWLQG